MKSEENKGFSRFQFSTELDRVDGNEPKKAKKTTNRRTRRKTTTRKNGSNRRTIKRRKPNTSKDIDIVVKDDATRDEIKRIMDSIVIADESANGIEPYKEEVKKALDSIVDNEETDDYKKNIEKEMDSIVIEDDDPSDDALQYKEKLEKILNSIVLVDDVMENNISEDKNMIVSTDNSEEENKDTIVLPNDVEELQEQVAPIENSNNAPSEDEIKRIMDTIVLADDVVSNSAKVQNENVEDVSVSTPDFKVFGDDQPPVDVRSDGEEGISISAENVVINDEPVIVNEAPVVNEEVKDKDSQAFLDELASLKEKGVHLNEARDIDLDHTLYRDQYFIKDAAEDKVVEEVKDALENTSDLGDMDLPDKRTIRKIYLSFHARLVLLILGVLVLFGGACFTIASALNSNTTRNVQYTEKSEIHYEVCQNVMNLYNASCIQEGSTYQASTTSSIKIKYHYEAKFDEEIDYDLAYHVVVVNKIFDNKDSNRVLYEDEAIIVEKENIKEGMSPASIDLDVDVDFQKYYNFVNEYKQKYSMNADSQLNVILYIDDGNNTRNVGEVIIPLMTENYDVIRNVIEGDKQEYILSERDWTNTNTIYIVVGSILVLLSLFLLFHLTKLALSVTGKKSKYQQYLLDLLNEYDRLIVIARDGYESNIDKKIVKVYTFDELLKIRDSLNKPIIYSRINSVKSEFIVEDEEVIYKFILKEADLGE